nr:cation:proton antiporter [Rhizobium sp. Root1220]
MFEAALSIRWRELRHDMLPVVMLSILDVVITAVVVAAGMVKLLAWPTASAVVFGVLIAATDPIAVVAMFKDTGIKGRLRLLVESESLFNDGVAAVLFSLALTWAQATGSSRLGMVTVASTLAVMTAGGILVGVIWGAAAVMLAGRTSDHLVQAAVTAVAAYGAFLLAENFYFSGVLATVSTGLIMGNVGGLREDKNRNVFSAGARSFVIGLWEFGAFLANSLIFLLIGLSLAPLMRVDAEAMVLAVGLVLVGRALSVYPVCLSFRLRYGPYLCASNTSSGGADCEERWH